MKPIYRKYLIVILSAVLLLGGITTLFALRWQAWFGNVSEAPYTVEPHPHNIVLTFGDEAPAQRTLTWRCDTALSPSFLRLLSHDNADTLLIPAKATIIATEGGKAAYYRVELDSLASGEYHYQCLSGKHTSGWHTFSVSSSDNLSFLLFGDIHDTGSLSAPMFSAAFARYAGSLDFMAFIGDMIERPTDAYWQVWFAATDNLSASLPVIAATGNHEYKKGIIKSLDPRWTHVFANPDNGPLRFLGRSYYIDFPHLRYVVVDTDALQRFSDYTVVNTWLKHTLRTTDKWTVVAMHHPVFAVGKRHHTNPMMYLFLHHALRDADVVFSGHDHHYMRRGTQPVYITTNSSLKHYPASKEPEKADILIPNMRIYEHVTLTPDTLQIHTYAVEDNRLIDSLTLTK